MNHKSFLILALITVLSIPAIYQIITPGYFPIHDDTQVVRVQQMFKSLSAGQFPVRWVSDLGYGYGYPIFNFYNPLPYYFGAALMFIGLNALAAAKIMFVFPVILSGLTMYLFSRILLPRWGAVLATILYIYAPYHAVQIYVRGAVAEYWAYALLPLAFWAIWKQKIILGGLTLASLIISHNLTAFMSIPFLLLTVILRPKAEESPRLPRSLRSLAMTLVIGLGASAFFWLPAIAEVNKTQVSQMVFEKFDPPALHLIKPSQLWSGPWGYGGSSPGGDDGLSLQLGKIHFIGGFTAIVILLACYIASLLKNKVGWTKTIYLVTRYQDNKITRFLVVALLFSLFMLLPYSAPIWNLLPILSYIQFPWRFLTFASLFASVLTTYGVVEVCETCIRDEKFRKLPTANLFLVTCSLLLIIYSFKFFQPQFKYPTSAAELTSRERMLWEVSGRSDEYLPIGFIRPNSLEKALRVDNSINQQLIGALKQPTPARRLGNIISLITVIGMIGYTVLQNTRKTQRTGKSDYRII